jgi:hypothetical protein
MMVFKAVCGGVPLKGALLFFLLVLTGVSTKSQSENVMKRQKKNIAKQNYMYFT